MSISQRVGWRVWALTFAVLIAPLGVEGRQAEALGTGRPATGADPASRFDYYLLSLSWSPTYCLTNPSDAAQCDGKGYGFVLHGLWPQYARGGYPEYCASANRLTQDAIELGKTIYPSPKLIRHEWERHGTCSGMGAAEYFELSDRARTSLKIPPELESPARPLNLTAARISNLFVQANPGLRADQLVVRCTGPELREIQVCFDQQLAPRACGRDVRSNCRGGSVRIPAIR